MTLLQLVAPGAVPAPTSPGDSILVVQTPSGFRLPSGPSVLLRAIFDRPQQVQWAALSVGALLFALGAFLVIRYRQEILDWLRTRTRAATIALGAVALVAVMAFGLLGWSGWQMMEHDNAFCTSCHLMHPMIARFYQTEHRHLECHECHRQSLLADTKELSAWVLERPGEVPPHGNAVPNRICLGCHASGDTAQGRQIMHTVGHVVHLTSTRQPGITCTQCHARPTVHVFRPSTATCTQGGCHQDVRIRLVAMQGVHNLQCTTCHDFLRPVGTIKPPFDSLERTILPIGTQCESCHQMRDRLQGQSFAADPHREQCGVCHNPHRQTDARAAAGSCSSGGCHARPDTLSRFHVGIPPRGLAQCSLCHSPHTWKAKSKVCADCHGNPDGPLPVSSQPAAGARAPRDSATARRVGLAGSAQRAERLVQDPGPLAAAERGAVSRR